MGDARPKVPYKAVVTRKEVEPDPKFSAPNESIKMHIVGPGESGKSALFKHCCLANGLMFSKKDRKLLRYHLIRTLVLGSCAMINYCQEVNSSIIKQFHKEVQLVDVYRKKNMPPDQEMKKMMALSLPDEVKTAVTTLWNHPDFQEAFRRCMQTGRHHVVESYRLIVEKLASDPVFYKNFGSKSYLPEDEMTLLSNGHKYHLEQKMYFQSEKNRFNKGAVVKAEGGQYYQRPDRRHEILRNPLRAASFKVMKKEAYWKIEMVEWKPQDGKLIPADPLKKGVIPERDCLVFTADLSGYDTQMGPAQGYRPDAEGYMKISLLARARYEFTREFLRGNMIALVFTNVDIFRRKYLDENLPLNCLGDFPGAPIRADEEEGSIRVALAFFKSYFREAAMEALTQMMQGPTANTTAYSERKRNLLKILCINGLDLSNVQATLTSLMESFYGFNIPIKNRDDIL